MKRTWRDPDAMTTREILDELGELLRELAAMAPESLSHTDS